MPLEKRLSTTRDYPNGALVIHQVRFLNIYGPPRGFENIAKAGVKYLNKLEITRVAKDAIEAVRAPLDLGHLFTGVKHPKQGSNHPPLRRLTTYNSTSTPQDSANKTHVALTTSEVQLCGFRGNAIDFRLFTINPA